MGFVRLTRRSMLKNSSFSLAALLAGRNGDALTEAEQDEQANMSGSQADDAGTPAPPNTWPDLHVDGSTSSITLAYNGSDCLSGKLYLSTSSGRKLLADAGIPIVSPGETISAERFVNIGLQKSLGDRDARESAFHFEFNGAAKGESLLLDGVVSGSDETFLAETLSESQMRFPLIRTSSGQSRNLRNNAVYDRQFDWALSVTADDAIRFEDDEKADGFRRFKLVLSGPPFTLSFRPRYYQKHRNISFFEPWRYRIWEKSVQGWCSWWAYFDKIDQRIIHKIADIFQSKLLDYGYRYIQIDDGYQRAVNGTVQDFLNTNEKFPDGLAALASYISGRQLDPAIWVSSEGNAQMAGEHPEWFIPGADGKPFQGPWIGYGINGAKPEAVDQLVRPLYRALRQQGWRYVKIDTLRHLLYDVIYETNSYFEKINYAPTKAFRNFLGAAREELGEDTYLLACWGVLPEAVGIANGCRLGGDGFGPATLTQYNSWNNVVWRNDPDHVDLGVAGEEIIRPVLISMAGAQMMLSDKISFYENESNLEGARRSSPVLFTKPGQLYDYDMIRTENLLKGLRNANGGQFAGPLDADQWGVNCPWWLMEVDRPFEHWFVLAHMSWEPLPVSKVRFADLGLPEDRQYAIYEFWSKRYLGVFSSSFDVPAQDAKETRVYSIRTVQDHPQIISTNRHISQGGADLVEVNWSDSTNTLHGASNVVKADRYEISFRIPKGYRLSRGVIDGAPAQISNDGDLMVLGAVPKQTRQISWQAVFTRSE